MENWSISVQIVVAMEYALTEGKSVTAEIVVEQAFAFMEGWSISAANVERDIAFMELLGYVAENAIRSAFAFTINSSVHAVFAAMQGLKGYVNMVESGTPVMLAPPFSAI